MFFSCWPAATPISSKLAEPVASGSAQTPAVFDAHSKPIAPLVWQWAVLAVVGTVIIAGVQNGIERVAKLSFCPILLLLVCDLRALTLSGAAAGVNFCSGPISPDYPGCLSRRFRALFLQMSVCMGVMTTIAAALGPDTCRSMLKVALSDTVVSIMAGWPFSPLSLLVTNDAGPSLLYHHSHGV